MPTSSQLYAQLQPSLSHPWKEVLSKPEAVPFVVQVLRDASAAILEIYNCGGVQAKSKECGSPVTEADMVSAAIIEKALTSRFGIPVVCEESDVRDTERGGIFWLVDPLDGTKEFLARNGEFSINIALVSGTQPVFGAIAVPATGEIYLGIQGEGAHRIVGSDTQPIFNRRTTVSGELVAAVSRSHGLGASDEYLEAIGVQSSIACGSAVKFCRLAEGACDVYVRFGRTMEWDTAAGHCILVESGCKLLDVATGLPLHYGKDGFANPSFVAARANLDLPRVAR